MNVIFKKGCDYEFDNSENLGDPNIYFAISEREVRFNKEEFSIPLLDWESFHQLVFGLISQKMVTKNAPGISPLTIMAGIPALDPMDLGPFMEWAYSNLDLPEYFAVAVPEGTWVVARHNTLCMGRSSQLHRIHHGWDNTSQNFDPDWKRSKR